jgi:hypothetical protein
MAQARQGLVRAVVVASAPRPVVVDAVLVAVSHVPKVVFGTSRS